MWSGQTGPPERARHVLPCVGVTADGYGPCTAPTQVGPVMGRVDAPHPWGSGQSWFTPLSGVP